MAEGGAERGGGGKDLKLSESHWEGWGKPGGWRSGQGTSTSSWGKDTNGKPKPNADDSQCYDNDPAPGACLTCLRCVRASCPGDFRTSHMLGKSSPTKPHPWP